MAPPQREPHVCLLLCGAQGDANRSDTDEDKTSTHLEEDFDKFRDLRATGVCGDDGGKDGRGATHTDLAQLGVPWVSPGSTTRVSSPFPFQR